MTGLFETTMDITKPILIVILLILLNQTTHAAQTLNSDKSIDSLAEELVKLRVEVESLNTELDNKKAKFKSRISVLANQRAELEASIGREELNIKQLQQSIKKNKKQIKELGTNSKELKPALMKSISFLKDHIASGIPFKQEDRIRELDKIKDQLNTDVIDAEKAANRLWASVEDEIRLTNENGIYRQTIDLNGKEVLADIAKLGMMFMYFEAPENKFGKVTMKNEKWQYEVVSDKKQKKQIALLFDSLRKQIRQGYFTLPNVSLLDKQNQGMLK